MANQTTPKPRIVGYGSGPRIYGGELVSTFFDGAAITITLGNLDARQDRLDDRPKGPPDLAISGQVTMTPAAAVKVIQAINNLLGTVAAHQAQKPQERAN